MTLLFGITGASGALYAKRCVLHACRLGHRVEAIVSAAGMQVLGHEGCEDLLSKCAVLHGIDDFFATPASGSSRYTGMAVVPCSMGTLGKMASGIADNLLTRAADVCLKEGRPLVVVPREMPLSTLHLENMLRLSRVGARLVPASPHFYQHPESVEALVDTVVAKILSQLGVEHDLGELWGHGNV